MAKLERVTAKVFASDAPADKIGQFGSALAGTKLETGDVSTIQALPAYTEGWSSAVISQRNYPVLQETNGVMKNMSYQTAYIMQNGIAEYDPDTEYYTGSICKGIGNTNQYASWGDENVGNDVTNSQYWKNVTPVNYSNITNCLLEVPQRIKYTLENGTLTIKAGSVVIVPYGTEDLTNQYPVGATFLNDNFKVYDTQFADGKFFVWVELVNDAVRDLSALTSETGYRVVDIDFSLSSESTYIGTGVRGESGTGSTASATYTVYYNTNTNFMYYAGDTTTLTLTNLSLPFAIYDVNTDTINQVFNGMGYIGSTVWVDKGVKGLIPNYRNKDGSLNNIEWVNDKIRTTGAEDTGNFYVAYQLDIDNFGIKNPASWVFNENENIFVYKNGTEHTLLILGNVNLDASVVTSLNPKQPFRAVDYNDYASTPHIVQTYVSGTSWYRVWSDGWIEQGGALHTTVDTTNTGVKTVTYLKAFSNANYTLVSNIGDDDSTYVPYYRNPYAKTKSGFTYNKIKSEVIGNWYACGY